jgi:transposase
MLTISGNARGFVFGEPINMRKSFEGLCAITEQFLKEEPTSGAFFVFLNRQRNKMKVLYWDNDGFAIWYKRLEKGRFPPQSSEKTAMNRREFFMLLEGIIPKKIGVRFSFKNG